MSLFFLRLFLAIPFRGWRSRSSPFMPPDPQHTFLSQKPFACPPTSTTSLTSYEGFLFASCMDLLSNISTIPPLNISRQSQFCFSYFVTKPLNLSCPSDILILSSWSLSTKTSSALPPPAPPLVSVTISKPYIVAGPECPWCHLHPLNPACLRLSFTSLGHSPLLWMGDQEFKLIYHNCHYLL